MSVVQERPAVQVGGFFRSADTVEYLASLPTVARCAFCPGFRFVGTAAEAVERGKAHRAAAHPGVVSVSVKARQIAARRHAYVAKEAA